MREIKFRAWYGNSMTEVGVLEFIEDGRIFVNAELVNVKLMQYIGLKDKNGREIYEGDIIKIKSSLERKRGIKNGAKYVVVTWRKGNCQFSGYSSVGEIIGNIYENPELLKEKK